MAIRSAHRTLGSSLALLPLLVGCIGAASPSPIFLATDPSVVATSTSEYACVPNLAMNHLEGDVVIDLGRPVPVVIRAGDREVMVTWPAGFRLLTDPTPRLVDPAGRLIAEDGTHLSFPPLAIETAAGTATDPYILSGRIGDDCYVAT